METTYFNTAPDPCWDCGVEAGDPHMQGCRVAFTQFFAGALEKPQQPAGAPFRSDPWNPPFMPFEAGERRTEARRGHKDRKPERMSWIPSEALWELARVYGYGAERHADPHQYLHGYEWSASIDAAERHFRRWQNGESRDESGYSHLMHAAWHLFTLYMFEQHGIGDDDRISTTHVRRPHTIERGRL